MSATAEKYEKQQVVRKADITFEALCTTDRFCYSQLSKDPSSASHLISVRSFHLFFYPDFISLLRNFDIIDVRYRSLAPKKF